MSPACSGWNDVSTGDYGQVEFIPDDCDRSGCDLDDAFVVGGTAEVSFRAVDDAFRVDDQQLISSNPDVFDVFFESDTFDPTYRIEAYAPGRADLVVIDRDGYEIDATAVEVEFADRLALARITGTAEGPFLAGGDIDERWRMPAGTYASFDVAPLDRNGNRLMGVLTHTVEIDQPLLQSLSAGSDLARGDFALTAPAGEHLIDFTAPDGASVRVALVGE